MSATLAAIQWAVDSSWPAISPYQKRILKNIKNKVKCKKGAKYIPVAINCSKLAG